jgi:hypothetical protein
MSDYSLYTEEVRRAQSLDEIERMVWRFSAQAPTNSSDGILYSGRFNGKLKTEQAAIELSRRTGAAIINNTPRGRLLGDEGVWTVIRDRSAQIFESQGMDETLARQSAEAFLFGDTKAPPDSPLSIKNCLWCKSSREFVSSLRGEVYVVSDGAPPNRVFAQVEFPAALENPKITTIGGMHREHLVALSKHNPKNMLEMVERPFHEAAPHITQNAEKQIEFSPRAWSEMGVQTPTMRTQGLAMKGAGALGVAAAAYDAATTAQNVANQLNQGNSTAAQSEVQHFGGRNLGMVAGAVAGTQLGAAAGVESGPGVFVTGAVGGIVGAIGGDKLMDAADEARIYRQRGSDDNLWHRDANHPAQGWTRMVQTSEIDTSVLPNLDTGMPVYKIQTLHASAHLADELNYKASVEKFTKSTLILGLL